MVLNVPVEVGVHGPPIARSGGVAEAWEVASKILACVGIDPDSEEGRVVSNDISCAVGRSVCSSSRNGNARAADHA